MNFHSPEVQPQQYNSTKNGSNYGSAICKFCSYRYISICKLIANRSQTKPEIIDENFQNQSTYSMSNSRINSNHQEMFSISSNSFRNENYFDITKINDYKKGIKEDIDKLQKLLLDIEKMLEQFCQINHYLNESLKILTTQPNLNNISNKQRIEYLTTNINQNNLIEQWKEWGESCLTIVQQQKDEIEKLVTNLIDKNKKCQTEQSGSKLLQGAELFGMKHGDYQYIIDGSILYAGMYQANKKLGVWQIYGKKKFYTDLQEISYQLLYEDGYLKYMKDGLILQIKPENQEEMNLYNVEQLENLEWKGMLKKNKLQGLWQAFWRGQCLDSGGYYDDLGFKNGIWKELYYNYWDNAQVKFYVNYRQGRKEGRSKIIYDEQIIGGGDYTNGMKNGRWVEINQHFCKNQEITERGQYRNDIKIGKWNIYLKNQYIGGGDYINDGQKIGEWIEIHQNYHKKSPIFYVGNYDNGVRNGEWQIRWRTQKIGGGMYVNGMKQGEWKQISENFYISPEGDTNFRSQQVYYIGKYENNLKIGDWESKIIIKNNILSQQENEEVQQYKGQYINGYKNGKWIEVSKNFNDSQQIKLTGEYNYGVKIGSWQISQHNIFEDRQQESSLGGKYGEKGQKIDDWIELYDNFIYSSIIRCKGKYSQGLKYGKWIIIQDKEEIGGGDYIENQIKNGHWIEIYDNLIVTGFTFEGKYQNGFRVEQWFIKQKNKNTQSEIGGGEFDIFGKKQGFWTELHENYNRDCQITYHGKYNNSTKNGKWEIKYLKEGDSQFQTIGGGEYDCHGQKTGLWTELYQNFTDESQITATGTYIQGKKQGRWKFILQDKEIGGGLYDQDGLKTGEWNELKDYFSKKVDIQKIKYKNGINTQQ